MAKAPKNITVAYPSVETVLASIEAADAKSHAGIVQAKATMVADLIAAIRGKVAPLTAETWKSTWADPVKAMLTAAKNADGSNRYNSAGTISVTLSWMRNVFLALSNVPNGANEHALLPASGEVSFQAYAQGVRARLALPQFKILEEVKERGPKPPSRKAQVKALQAQVKAAEAKLAAATAKVTDNAQTSAPVVNDAKAAAEALAHIPAVDTMIALMKHEHFGSATRDDANVLLAALRKNPTALLTMAKALAS